MSETRAGIEVHTAVIISGILLTLGSLLRDRLFIIGIIPVLVPIFLYFSFEKKLRYFLYLFFFSTAVSITAMEITGVFLVGLVLWGKLYRFKREDVSMVYLRRAMVCLLVYAVVVTVFSLDPLYSLQFSKKFWKIVIAVGIFFIIMKEPGLSKPCLIYLVTGSLVSAAVSRAGLGSEFEFGILRKHAAGALYIVSSITLLAILTRSLSRITVICVTAVFFFFYLNNRQALIGYLIATFVFLIFRYRRLALAGCLLGAVMLSATEKWQGYVLRLNSPEKVLSGVAAPVTSNVLDRLSAWRMSLDYWKKYPLLGMGMNVFDRIEHPFLWYDGISVKKGQISPHSMYFKALVDGGIFALALLAAFFYYILKQIIVIYRKTGAGFGSDLLVAAGSILSAGLVMGFLNEILTDGETFLLVSSFVALSLAAGIKSVGRPELFSGEWRDSGGGSLSTEGTG